MNMHNDGAMAQRLHGVAEDVSGCGLHDVFHELGTVGVEAFPFLSGADAFLSNTLAAELIDSDLRFYIGQLSAGRERDKQHATSAGEGQSVKTGRMLIFHGLHNSTVHQNSTIFGFACRHASTSEGSSSSVKPISIAPIALSAPTLPP